MYAMKSLCFCAVAALVWGCGGTEGQDVKTPDQLIAEQERLAIEDEKKKAARGEDPSLATAEETDAEKKREFDQKQVKMELARATRSAESCPGVVAEMETKEHPRGETRVTVTFIEDGTVRDVSIPSPFDGTPIGECVKRAYKAVIVPPYTGGEQIIDWDLTLKDEKVSKGDAKAKKKK